MVNEISKTIRIGIDILLASIIIGVIVGFGYVLTGLNTVDVNSVAGRSNLMVLREISKYNGKTLKGDDILGMLLQYRDNYNFILDLGMGVEYGFITVCKDDPNTLIDEHIHTGTGVCVPMYAFSDMTKTNSIAYDTAQGYYFTTGATGGSHIDVKNTIYGVDFLTDVFEGIRMDDFEITLVRWMDGVTLPELENAIASSTGAEKDYLEGLLRRHSVDTGSIVTIYCERK